MIGIPLGLLAANAGEWFFHKHVLHGRGVNKKSFWSFHWHEHHSAVRKHDHVDPAYKETLFQWNGQAKEALMLSLGTAATALPLLPVAPFFSGAVIYAAINYYRVHKKSHIDTEWAREKVPWHYDHHMGPNQHANWCVTKPWFDIIMSTRDPYVGTERERKDRARRDRREKLRAAKRAAAAA